MDLIEKKFYPTSRSLYVEYILHFTKSVQIQFSNTLCTDYAKLQIYNRKFVENP